MNHKIVSLIVSADWHLGTVPLERFCEELLDLVKRAIAKTKTLDLFIVAGDVFDMKEYLSSETVKTFFYIMGELLRLTEPYNTQFRFLEGTRTHDALQLDTLDIIFTKLFNCRRIKFIQTVEVESIFGMDILYIPTEYVLDDKEYYKEYFDQRYDMLFGHGMTDMMWYAKSEGDSYTSAPVFKVDQLCQVAYYSYFGHVHYHKELGEGNRFKSIGPVSRWEFDKDGPCGLYAITYDTDTHVAFEKFILNDKAQILPTIKLSIKKDYELDELHRMVNKKLAGVSEDADRIKLDIEILAKLDTFTVMRDYLISAYNNQSKLKLSITPIGEQKQKDSKLTEEQAIEEKPYLYDKSLNDEARIASRIKLKKGVNIPLEYIKEVITASGNQKGLSK